MLLKKLLCLVLSIATLATPVTSQAVDLGAAFDNLIGPGVGTSVNQPGRFQSGARSGFTAGGAEVRFPRGANMPQLFSISPPRIEAGCNGISAHFGGFSFISGKEFEQLLKQIASGAALGFVTSLVMKTLCPPCEAVVQELKTAAQMAARLAKDSCAFGQKLGADFMAGLSTSPDSTSKCAITTNNNNGSGDALFSFESLCSGLEKASSKLKEWNQSLADMTGGNASDPKSKYARDQQAQCAEGSGNLTWSRLSAFNNGGMWGSTSGDAYYSKLLIINVMGAELKYTSGRKIGCELTSGQGTSFVDEKGKTEMFCPPPLPAERMVDYFMCGSPASVQGSNATASMVGRYCSKVFTPTTSTTNQAWKCTTEAPGDDGRTGCDILRLADTSEVFRGKGFLSAVHGLLTEAVTRVRNNEDLLADITRNGETYSGRNIMGLIQTAPYPLYQAINAAAVYPTATQDLIDNLSVLVAEQFAYAYFDELLRLRGQSATDTTVCISKPQADRMLEFIESMRNTTLERRKQIASNFQLQQAVTEQIRQVNLAIQRQVMTSDMLSSNRMAESLNKAVNANIVKSSP